MSGPSIASNSIEAATIRKLRIRLLPLLFALFVVAFIDRINLGFAALTMNRELAITSQQFGFAAGIFFWGYFLFEIPSNLMLHKIGARVWIARILITWGAVATLTGFVQSAHQLYVARFALGLAEAGYFPGIVLYLGYWFRQREKAQAIALILIGIPLASVLGGPISGFILDHAHWFGLSSWRWLLILEGLPAVVFAFLTPLLLPSRPAEARFLTAEEKAWIADQLEREDRQKLGAKKQSISVARTLVHPRVWHLACIGFAHGFASYTFSFWLPQVMKSVLGGQSNTVVGFAVMIPNFAWPDRDDPRVSSLRPHAGAAISHGNFGRLSWNCLAAARSASLAFIFCCSFFGRRYWSLQLFACLFLDARRIPDRLLSSCGHCASDIRRQLRRLRRTLHGRPDSPKDGQLLLRPDLRRSFFPCIGELGFGPAQASPACSWSTVRGGRRSLETDPEALLEES